MNFVIFTDIEMNCLTCKLQMYLNYTGATYKGLKFRRGICGVSIVRSGMSN